MIFFFFLLYIASFNKEIYILLIEADLLILLLFLFDYYY